MKKITRLGFEFEGEEIKIEPIEEVLTKDEIKRIKKYRKLHQCHYNSCFTMIELSDVEYCEGILNDHVPHSFCYHTPTGRYFDPTLNNPECKVFLIKKYDRKEVIHTFRTARECFVIFWQKLFEKNIE